ncbi:MAG: glycoside hydrolase family 78 protein [Akkermansiaceae bacterium]|jgi:alpha-L-rhamnosidase|nr:glycoside hydrolase family 78 protein [Akkermansiaceae bacterium]
MKPILSAIMLGSLAHAAPLPPIDLRTEYLVHPEAIDTPVPRFSWRLDPGDGEARSILQSAYEIRVDADPAGTEPLWSSGKVASADAAQIEYAGKALKSRDRATWRVRVWTGGDEVSGWSEPATFAVGLLDPLDWEAQWISMRDDGMFETSENVQNFKEDPVRGKLHLTPAKHFRKEFESPVVKRAILHATALGVFKVEINGQRVSDERLAPGWSAYHRRIHSRTYDVTKLVSEGGNAIGATLADGWYCGYVAYGLLTLQPGLLPGIHGRSYYGISPAIRLQLELELTDGTKRMITTGPDWKCATGPYLEADILQGETYDARKEMPGWSKPGFDDGKWEQAVVKTGTDARVLPHPGPPVRPIMEMPTQTVTPRGEGTYIFDLGQNISGVVRLKVRGQAGDRITLRHAEILHQDGRMSTENLRCARAVDTYILRGDPEGETWIPEFTYHGFQYVEVSGLREAPQKDAVTGIVLHSDTEFHGQFECSDPMLNRLYQNILWTQRGNFFEMPTDCPQRDERMGWTGDAQIYVRAATFNADIASFYKKWLRDLNDDQWDYGAYPPYAPRPFSRPNEHHAAGWMDAGVICPWTIWQVYGDTRVIREHWRNMKDFMEWRKLRDPELDGATDDCNFGDWLSLGEVKTPIPFIDLAYHAHDAMLMAEMAGAIGLPDEQKSWQAHADKVTAAFRKNYLNADGTLKVDNQTAYAMALFLGLIPEETKAATARRLADLVASNNHLMTTGFLGTRPLLPALSANGHHEISGKLIRQRNFPSWGYEVENGATTIWERWNSYEKGKGVHSPEMNSFSHYAFGAVGEWMMSELAGIDRASAGFKRVRIAPRPTGGITHASASMMTPHGKLSCAWKIEGGQFIADIIIPPNTTAESRFPVKGAPEVSDLAEPKIEGGVLLLGSGSYRITGEYLDAP